MSTGGIFQLITNDGKQDKLLLATDMLKARLAQISAARRNNPMIKDETPTLSDIEKTHILFMNAHFKPYCAIGYEYNKVSPSTGNTQLGEKIQFSIPQFGDFFHDIVLHVTLRQPTLSSTATADGDAPLMRWASYPGERLIKSCNFEVNGNNLDEYTSHSTNFHREFCVQPNKKMGWDRIVGQEVAEKGYVLQPTWVGNGVAAASVTSRFGAEVFLGNQTPTGQKTADLEMFIPLLFWFNRDPRLAIPSVAIPYGQRFINIQLAEQTELVNLFPRGSGDETTPLGALSTATNLIRKIELYINNILNSQST